MFLSQLLVNIGTDSEDKPRPSLNWIKRTDCVHQRIWMAFPDDKRLENDPFFLGTWSPDANPKPPRSEVGFLFRIEPDRPARVLVQSLLKPDWDYAFQNARHLITAPPLVREFDPVFHSGQSYRFRLVMLMVKRRSDRTRKTGTQTGPAEVPIRCFLPEDPIGAPPKRDPNCTAWRERLAAAAVQHGFTVDTDPKKLRVQPINNLRMKATDRENAATYNAAAFDGLLTCSEPELLRGAVINGVGRGKAFGMGLLSLALLQ